MACDLKKQVSNERTRHSLDLVLCPAAAAAAAVGFSITYSVWSKESVAENSQAKRVHA